MICNLLDRSYANNTGVISHADDTSIITARLKFVRNWLTLNMLFLNVAQNMKV